MSSSVAARAPMPRKPLAATRRIPAEPLQAEHEQQRADYQPQDADGHERQRHAERQDERREDAQARATTKVDRQPRMADADHDDHHLDDLDGRGEERGGEDRGIDHDDVSLPGTSGARAAGCRHGHHPRAPRWLPVGIPARQQDENGDRAPHGPVSADCRAACAPVLRPVVSSRYLAVAGRLGDPPPVSGRRASEVVMVCASFRRRAMTSPVLGGRACPAETGLWLFWPAGSAARLARRPGHGKVSRCTHIRVIGTASPVSCRVPPARTAPRGRTRRSRVRRRPWWLVRSSFAGGCVSCCLYPISSSAGVPAHASPAGHSFHSRRIARRSPDTPGILIRITAGQAGRAWVSADVMRVRAGRGRGHARWPRRGGACQAWCRAFGYGS